MIDSKNNFQVGNYLYNVIQGVLKDANNYGIITDLDLDNNYIYVSMVNGSFSNGDYIGDYANGDTPVGFATIGAKVDIAGAGAALVSDIKTSGLYKRLYLTDVVGTFSNRDTIISVDAYKTALLLVGNYALALEDSLEDLMAHKLPSNLLRTMAIRISPIPQDICSSSSMVSCNLLVQLMHILHSQIQFNSRGT